MDSPEDQDQGEGEGGGGGEGEGEGEDPGEDEDLRVLPMESCKREGESSTFLRFSILCFQQKVSVRFGWTWLISGELCLAVQIVGSCAHAPRSPAPPPSLPPS